MRRKLIVGNWKMNGSRPANAELLAALIAGRPYAADVAVCVPAVFLTETAATLAGSDLRWGAQDVSAHDSGAYTGEISAAMLHECGCRYAIVGHSERRAYHGESDLLVAQKAQAALARDLAGLRVDVLKVPHHGSRHQDLDWLTSLGARLALVSVGEDNDYGHPAPDLVAALDAAGASVWRTDVSGDVVVMVRDGELGVVARG